MPWSRVNTEYSIHRVQHTLSTAYTTYRIIPTLTVSRSQPVSHLLADHVVLNSLHSHYYEWTNKLSLSSRRASLLNRNLQIHSFQVLLQSHLMMASKCISKLTWSRPRSACPTSHDHCLQVYLQTRTITGSKFARSPPPSASPNSLDHSVQVYLQTPSITASKCISKLALSQTRSASPNSLNHSLQLYLQTHSITVSECICKFTRSRYGDPVESESRHPISNIPPHLEWHSKLIHQTQQLWLHQLTNRVWGYEGIPGHDEPHESGGSMNDWQYCVRNHTYFVDLWKLGKSVWGTIPLEWIYQCLARVHETKRWDS